MSENNLPGDAKNRFERLAGDYRKKLPGKFELLLPFKDYIERLLAKQASYNDIRLLLEDVNVLVSKDTVHRFCRKMIGPRPIRQRKSEAKENASSKTLPITAQPVQPQAENIETRLREQRERFPGPWSRTKRGPRIADSKNL